MTDTKLITLAAEFEAFIAEQEHYALNGLPTGEAEAAEEARLGVWSDTIINAIMEERPTTPEGWAAKLRVIAYYNDAGELTPADRVAQADSHSDAFAWALVRDLMEARAA